MPRCIAFLRALNVGGHTVKMNHLKLMFESLGYANVETFIASGNVIFTTKSAPGPAMATKIEKKLLHELGYDVETFIRTDAEVASLAERVVFSAAEIASSHSTYVGLLRESLSADAINALATFNNETDSFRHQEKEIHFLTRIGMGASSFSNVKFEKQLGVPTTFRNINTMVRLARKYPPK